MAANSGVPLIESNHRAIRLMLENIEADVHDHRLLLKRGQDFLEGINLPGEEGFAEWLCEMRKDLQSFDLRRQPTTTLKTRSEEHTSELQTLMRISYAVFCSTNKTHIKT